MGAVLAIIAGIFSRRAIMAAVTAAIAFIIGEAAKKTGEGVNQAGQGVQRAAIGAAIGLTVFTLAPAVRKRLKGKKS